MLWLLQFKKLCINTDPGDSFAYTPQCIKICSDKDHVHFVVDTFFNQSDGQQMIVKLQFVSRSLR